MKTDKQLITSIEKILARMDKREQGIDKTKGQIEYMFNGLNERLDNLAMWARESGGIR